MMHLAFTLPFFFIIGIFVGILTMVYGLGGGTIIVPFIYFYLHFIGFDATVAMRVAVGTSLLNVFIGTLSVSYRNQKARNIAWPFARRFIPCVIVGSFFGLLVMHHLKGSFLREIFIVFLIAIILNSFFNKDFKVSRRDDEFRDPTFWQLGGIGVFVGVLASLVGIGGGLVVIPYLRHLRMTMTKASATSAIMASCMALFSTLGYIVSGLHETLVMPPYTVGFVNILIFVCIQLGTFLGLSFGQKIDSKLTDVRRARWFPIVLVVMVLLMLI